MLSKFFPILLILVSLGCNSSQQKKAKIVKESATVNEASLRGNETPESIKKTLNELKPKLISEDGMTVNKEVAVDYIQQIKMLSNRYPKDIEVPKYLSTAAELCRGIGEINEALALYGQVHTTYPKHPLAAPALFFQGFILENEIGNKEKAKSNYQGFLTRFPNHEFAEIVQSNLDAIDKTTEELIESFKSKN